MDTLKLCVSCKACRHECPTGVDMAKMKIEVLAARAEKHGLSLRDRLVGYLPRYADLASRFAPLANWRNNSPLLRALFEKFAGISAKRALPAFRRDVFKADAEVFGPADGHEVVLFADTFNRAYERENLDAALRVLVEGGYRVHIPRPVDRARPLCCGRTFLSAGLVEQARSELDRLVATYAPFAARGVPIVGLEPSCLLTLRDELLSLRSDNEAKSVSAHALLFEEFLVREAEAGRLKLPLGAMPAKALVHGHCHQKSFGAFKPVEKILRLIPDLECRNHRIQLLRHGRRVRLRRRHLSGLDGNGRAVAAAGGTPRRRRHADRRRRHLVPAPDQGWHEPCSTARRPGARDEPRQRATQPLIPTQSQRNLFMAELTLDVARKILDAALAKGVEKKLKPLVITILDARGCVKVTAAQDGTSLMRAEIAHGKAYGALAMGMGAAVSFSDLSSAIAPSFSFAIFSTSSTRFEHEVAIDDYPHRKTRP